MRAKPVPSEPISSHRAQLVLKGNLIADFAIREPVLIAILMAAIILGGLYAFFQMQIALLPATALPTIAVVVPYPGASPPLLADSVVKPIEDQIATLDQVDSIHSTAADDAAVIIVEFKTGVNLDTTQQTMQARINAIRPQLPLGVLDPVYSQYDQQTDQPILLVAVNRPDGMAPEQLYQILKDHIAPAVQGAQGVRAVTIVGGHERQINVNLDLRRLQALRVPPAAVTTAIGIASTDTGLGSVPTAAGEYKLRASSVFTTPQDIANVAIGVSGATVGDVATVEDGHAEDTSYTRLNGGETVVLAISKQRQANTTTTADAALAELNRSFAAYPNLTFRVVQNQAHEVQQNIDGALEDIALALIFAVLVVWAFFRDVRHTVVTVIGLPIIVAGTFIAMYLLGLSLNIVTLMALSVSVGMVIDDAIVVRENVFRNLELGFPPFQASSRGAQQVVSSVLSMTMTIIAVFVTMLNSPGLPGIIFRAFALTVISAMLVSLFEAFTSGPMLSARWLTPSHRQAPPDDQADDIAAETVKETPLLRRYQQTLEWALRHRALVLLVTVAILAGTGILALGVPVSFLPADENGQFGVSFELAPGTPLAGTDRQARQVEQILRQDPQVENVLTVVGGVNGPEYAYFFVSHTAGSMNEIQGRLRPQLAAWPRLAFSQTSYEFSTLTMVPTRPIQVQIRSDRPLEEIAPYAERLQAAMKTVPGLTDVDSSYTPNVPRISYRIDQHLARQYGFSNLDVVTTLRTLVSGMPAGKYRENGSAYNISVRLRREDRQTIDAISNLGLPYGPSLVPLSTITSAEWVGGPKNVLRYNRQNAIILGGNNTGRNYNYVIADIQQQIDQNPPPAGVTVQFGGSTYNQQEQAFSSLQIAFYVGIVLIYIVLAVAFRSFTQPIVLMIALPLSLVGAVLAARLLHLDINNIAMIGVVMLLGLVTKNSIMLLDYTNRLLEAGLPLNEALVRAAIIRTRPILMTSAAIIFGNLPTALGLGAGAELRRGLGIVVIGGMLTSTLMTLYVIPTAYSVYASVMAFFQRRMRRSSADASSAAPCAAERAAEP